MVEEIEAGAGGGRVSEQAFSFKVPRYQPLSRLPLKCYLKITLGGIKLFTLFVEGAGGWVCDPSLSEHGHLQGGCLLRHPPKSAADGEGRSVSLICVSLVRFPNPQNSLKHRQFCVCYRLLAGGGPEERETSSK